MESDDNSGACKCDKFIASNTIINGFQRGVRKNCDTLDKLKPAN